MSSGAEVIVVQARHVIAARPADVISTKTSHATATEAAHVTSTEATHVAPAKAAHTATMSSTPAATAGLCTRRKKAAGKHCACQNHHHSSSHDILHLRWADFPPLAWLGVGVSQQSRTNVAMDWRWECLPVIPTKFAFIRIDGQRTRTSSRDIWSEKRAKRREHISNRCALTTKQKYTINKPP